MKLSPRNFTEGPVVFDNMAEGMTDLMLQVFFLLTMITDMFGSFNHHYPDLRLGGGFPCCKYGTSGTPFNGNKLFKC